MLVRVVGLLNVGMYVFVSMILVFLCMEILLTSVMPCGLRWSLISSKEHNVRPGDFEKFRVGWGYVFMVSFPNCFHFSIFFHFFLFVVCIIMVLFIAFLILIGLQCVSIVFWIRSGDSLVIGVSYIDSSTINWLEFSLVLCSLSEEDSERCLFIFLVFAWVIFS